MAFSDPKQIIAQCGLTQGARVADFGTGSGHYAIAAARAVGENGRVIAIDIQRDLAARVKREAEALGLHNVDIIWGDIEEKGGSKLGDASVDVVILANALFQMHHRGAVLAEAFRILKQNGMLVFVEWSDSFAGLGPVTSEVIAGDVARELFERAGFKMHRALEQVGDHHYGFIVKKS